MRTLGLAVLLFANYFFYARWGIAYLFLIPAASTCDFLIGLGLQYFEHRLVRRLLRQPDAAAQAAGDAPPPLSSDQARQVRDVAYQQAKHLGLDDDQATLLANSVIGGLVVG